MNLSNAGFDFNNLDPNPDPNRDRDPAEDGSGSSSGGGPEPLKHSHGHYWKTRPRGYIMERWVVGRDEGGRIVHQVELVDRRTGERQRKKVRRYEKLPTLLKIAGGGGMAAIRKPAKMEGEMEGEASDEATEWDGEGRGENVKKGKRKCHVM